MKIDKPIPILAWSFRDLHHLICFIFFIVTHSLATRSLLWFIIHPLCPSVDISLHVCLNIIVSFVLLISKFLLIHLVCSFDPYSVYAWLLSFVNFTEQSLWYNRNLISSGTSPMHYSSPQWMSNFFLITMSIFFSKTDKRLVHSCVGIIHGGK